jgi:hypothetical protein
MQSILSSSQRRFKERISNFVVCRSATEPVVAFIRSHIEDEERGSAKAKRVVNSSTAIDRNSSSIDVLVLMLITR